MEEEGWLSLGVAAALAREYATHQREFLGSLASLLEGVLPGQVEVVRRGGLLSVRKPVSEIRVELGDARYALESPSSGPVAARRSLVKRGIVLRTEEIPVETWLEEVGAALEEHAKANEQAAAAMRRFGGA